MVEANHPIDELAGRTLLQQSASGDEAAYTSAQNTLACMGPEKRLTIFLKGLGDSDVRIQRAASRDVSFERDGRAFEPLMKLYERASDPELRSNVISALHDLADPRCLTLMLRDASHREWQRRCGALYVLQAIHDPAVLEALREALRDPKREVRESAKQGLLHWHIHQWIGNAESTGIP